MLPQCGREILGVMTEEKEYSLLLGKDCKLRAEATRRLLAEYGTAKEVFKAPEREIERLDYLNEKENYMLKNKCERAGISESTFFRKCITNSNIKEKPDKIGRAHV